VFVMTYPESVSHDDAHKVFSNVVQDRLT